MPDDNDFAADLAERERAALIARHRARLPPPEAPPRGAVFRGTNAERDLAPDPSVEKA